MVKGPDPTQLYTARFVCEILSVGFGNNALFGRFGVHRFKYELDILERKNPISREVDNVF